MYKKGFIVVLCITLLLGNLGSLVYADSNKGAGAGKRVSSPAITASWLVDQYGVETAWIQEKIAEGHTFYQMYKALSGKKSQDAADAALAELQIEDAIQWNENSDISPLSMRVTGDSEVDDAALEQVHVHDDASSYFNRYGEDAVSMASGNLHYVNTDLELPGMIPFELTRMYDSSKANEQIGVRKDETGQAVNDSFIRRQEVSSALGRGWSWNLPDLQEIGGTWYLYFPGAGTFSLSESLDILGYNWNDMELLRDQSVTVNGLQSEYKLTVLNDYLYFFDTQGYLIQIQDLYGNTVSFHYEQLPDGRVLKRITNNDGNTLQFSHSTLNVSVELEGAGRKVQYRKVQKEGYTLLAEVIDPLSRSTSYVYNHPQSKFNFLSGLAGQPEQHGDDRTALLTRIVYPTSRMTDIQYEAAVKQIGDFATRHVFKVGSRKDTFSTTSGERLLGSRVFEYSGEDLNSFGQNVDLTTTVKSEKREEIYKLNKSFEGNSSPSLYFLREYRQSSDSAGFVQAYDYDEAIKRNTPRQVTETYIQNGAVSQPVSTTYIYDEYGLVTSETSSTGQKTSYEYEQMAGGAAWKKPTMVTVKMNDTQTQVTKMEYDDQGSVTSYVVSEGAGASPLAQSEYAYDSYGNLTLTKVRDTSRFIEQTYKYESPYGLHLLTNESIVVRDASSGTSVIASDYSYWPTGELKSKKDGDGHVQSYSYDSSGRITQIDYSDGTRSSVRYDDTLNRITRTAPDGVITTEQYDPFGLLVQEQTHQALFEYEYDEEGNMTVVTDAEGNATTQVYDAFGRNTKTVFPDGTSSSTDYQLVDRTITYTDAAGNKQREVYDLLGRTTSTEEWKNGAYVPLQQMEYDLLGQIIATVDGNQQRTEYAYDVMGRLTSVKDPKGDVTRYVYSMAGDLVQVVFPDQQKVTKSYDELGRLISQTDMKNQTTLYEYDRRGNVTRMVDRNNQTHRYEYDSENLLLSKSGSDYSVQYTYDDAGRRASMTDQLGTSTYEYYPEDGRLKELTYPDGTKVAYEYNTQTKTGYVLTDSAGASIRVSSELDEMNRVSVMEITAGSSGASIMSASPMDRMTFEYSDNSLLERRSFDSGLSTGFSYDGYDLSGVTVRQGSSSVLEFGYRYDPNKNIISRTENGTTGQFTYDPLNRIESEALGDRNLTYTYDANGNRLEQGSGKLFGLKEAEYTFDSQNRLSEVTGEGKEVSYTYNGDGLLYERKEGTAVTRYYYDEEAKLIAEAEVSGGKATITYAYVYDLYGQLTARQDRATGKLQYYQFNGHGDVVGLVDEQGTPLNTYTYDIWGGPEETEETVPNVMRYAGEYWDETTGLQYLRARWYDPGTARFIGEDTYEGELGNPLTLNLYAYVGNNPLIYVDPSGNVWKWVNDGWKLIQKGAKSAVDFLIMDDLRTLVDPKSSFYDRAMAGIGFIPVGKIFKGGKVFIKWANKDGKVVEKVLKECNCFTAGTMIQTDGGEKNIEAIKVGDKVLSKNEETGEVAYKEVTATFNHETDEIYKIHVGGQTIESTFNHPFYVKDKGWTFVKDLKPGDLLVQSDGNTLKIESIELEYKQVTVYNMTVDEFHTYFVSDLGIWVHNTNCGYKDITVGKSVRNIETNVTRADFEKSLVGDGWTKSVSKDGLSTIYSKDGASYRIRDKSNEGSKTAEYWAKGATKATTKIRLGG